MLSISIVLYIAVTLGIGFWASKRIKTTNDFTLAGKSLPMVLVGVTIFATWFGPELIMGVPGLFVKEGIKGIIIDQFGNFTCLILVAFFFFSSCVDDVVIKPKAQLRLDYSEANYKILDSRLHVHIHLVRVFQI